MKNKKRKLVLADALYASVGIDAGSKRSVTIVCPNCRKKKLSVNLTKNLFNCPVCSSLSDKRGAFGGNDPVLLYAFLRHEIPPYVLKEDKQKRKAMEFEFNDVIGKSNYIAQVQTFDPESNKADDQTLDIAYRALYDELVLYDDHFNSLAKRGLPEHMIEKMGFKSVPIEEDRIKISKKLNDSGITLKGVPGFFLGRNGWELKRNSPGFFIFIRNAYGQIIGAQIANDDRTFAKYYQLSSSGLNMGTGSGTPIHHIGSLKGEDTVYLTEGPLKANVAHYYTKKPYIAILGINALSSLDDSMKALKKAGVKTVVMAIDMDYKTNPHVNKGRNIIIKRLRKYGFKVNDRFSWDPKYKGIDDFLFWKAYEQGLYKPKFRVRWENSSVHPTPENYSRFD